MSLQKKLVRRIRKTADSKLQVIITGKARNREGFRVTGPGKDIPGLVTTHHRTKAEAVSALLVRLRCMDPVVWKLEPVKPNPALRADVPWKRKLL